MKKIFICIDLKSFFASCECSKRNLDPFTTNLVVADKTRGENALCLAITPAMKKLGIKNRCRTKDIPGDISYIIAKPRMKMYMEYSAKIYGIYLRYVSSKDVHVYSIDECFIDITSYLKYYKKKPKEFAEMLMSAVFEETGITATVGIGTNLYLAKIAMDIIAKHVDDNIGMLTENTYRKYLWHYTPLTDFWHIGQGISNHLNRLGIYDMYDLAHYDQKKLYKEFGINAEYMIDHALGKEPTTIADIKAYVPKTNSLSNSQILTKDYNYEDAFLVMKEMVDTNVTRLVKEHKVTDCVSICVAYSKRNGGGSSGGQRKMTVRTNSLKTIRDEFIILYKEKVTANKPIRQIGISFHNVMNERFESYDLFTDIEKLEKEKNVQKAIILIQTKYGKNSIMKGMNKLENATGLMRNQLIGGHNAI